MAVADLARDRVGDLVAARGGAAAPHRLVEALAHAAAVRHAQGAGAGRRELLAPQPERAEVRRERRPVVVVALGACRHHAERAEPLAHRRGGRCRIALDEAAEPPHVAVADPAQRLERVGVGDRLRRREFVDLPADRGLQRGAAVRRLVVETAAEVGAARALDPRRDVVGPGREALGEAVLGVVEQQRDVAVVGLEVAAREVERGLGVAQAQCSVVAVLGELPVEFLERLKQFGGGRHLVARRARGRRPVAGGVSRRGRGGEEGAELARAAVEALDPFAAGIARGAAREQERARRRRAAVDGGQHRQPRRVEGGGQGGLDALAQRRADLGAEPTRRDRGDEPLAHRRRGGGQARDQQPQRVERSLVAAPRDVGQRRGRRVVAGVRGDHALERGARAVAARIGRRLCRRRRRGGRDHGGVDVPQVERQRQVERLAAVRQHRGVARCHALAVGEELLVEDRLEGDVFAARAAAEPRARDAAAVGVVVLGVVAEQAGDETDVAAARGDERRVAVLLVHDAVAGALAVHVERDQQRAVFGPRDRQRVVERALPVDLPRVVGQRRRDRRGGAAGGGEQGEGGERTGAAHRSWHSGSSAATEGRPQRSARPLERQPTTAGSGPPASASSRHSAQKRVSPRMSSSSRS
ncbi:MAG: hypothetical protein U1E73_11355 [Planctomycetota bacterium]